MSWSFGMSFQISWSDRKALPYEQGWTGRPPGCPEGLSGCPGVFRHPPVCLVVVGRPSWMSGRGRETPGCPEWSGGPPGCS